MSASPNSIQNKILLMASYTIKKLYLRMTSQIKRHPAFAGQVFFYILFSILYLTFYLGGIGILTFNRYIPFPFFYIFYSFVLSDVSGIFLPMAFIISLGLNSVLLFVLPNLRNSPLWKLLLISLVTGALSLWLWTIISLLTVYRNTFS